MQKILSRHEPVFVLPPGFTWSVRGDGRGKTGWGWLQLSEAFGTVLIFGSGAFCDLLEQIFETSLPQLWRCVGCIAAYQPGNVKQSYNGFLFSPRDLKQTLQHVVVACVLSLYSTCSFKTDDWNRSRFKSKLAFSLGFSSWWQKFPSWYLQSSRGPGSLSGHAVPLFPKVSATELLLKN